MTNEEKKNEKALKSDLRALIAAVKNVRQQPYLNGLPFYNDELLRLQRRIESIYEDAKNGYATANR